MSIRVKRKAASKIPIKDSDSESDNEFPKKKIKVDKRRETEKSKVKTSKKESTPKKQNEDHSRKKHSKISSSTTHKTDLLDACIVSRFPKHSKVQLKSWKVYELLAEKQILPLSTAKNIVNLFGNENTIPFICRYRRDLIGGKITPDRLREIKITYIELLNLQKRAETIIEKEKNLSDSVKNEFRAAKTMEELEYMYAPYKPANKGSLADRAISLGLDKPADDILFGKSPQVQVESLVKPSIEGLDTVDKVTDGIVHIISHNMSKKSQVLQELQRLQIKHRISLKSSQSRSSSSNSKLDKISKFNNNIDDSKYECYYKFECPVRYLKPHQILAINRGEKAKSLSVKIINTEHLKTDIKHFIKSLYLSDGIHYPFRSTVFEKSFDRCYNSKMVPFITRQIRSKLNEIATQASIDVFAKNLKQVLLISPLKGEKILGIDPGFGNGCKLALISETADLLDSGVIYPHTGHRNNLNNILVSGKKLAKMMYDHNCRIIALGNGTACRETECFISKLYEQNILDASLIKYSIVSEQGSSIYSCSEIAKKEFPKLDINLISAVSIARRLNDPLSEFIKIEPRHIGVGMYQHDINEKVLTESLNEVVMECVSFVGVDINTASTSILKHIAGLTESRAEKIVEYRQKNGPFKRREDLLKIKTIGDKTFTQCAGFIRIEEKSIGCKVENILDCTWIHPESYGFARIILQKLKLNLQDFGKPRFVAAIEKCVSHNGVDKFSAQLNVPKERIEIILNAMQREIFQDYRQDIDKKPLFKNGILKMGDLKRGTKASGAVTNVTHFGAFVDIGVETDGLIHTSNMSGKNLNIGDRVNTIVMEIDIHRKRIQLKLESILK